MAYDWKKSEEGGQQAQADKLPEGIHLCIVDRTITTLRTGELMKSRNGDPQMMVVYLNEKGQEGTEVHTLTVKAGWTLSRLLSRLGNDLDAMRDAGVEPQSFADPETRKK